MSAMGCADCGCPACGTLFDELLAREFQRLEPYGRFHGVTVAAYGVQHPSRFDDVVRRAQWRLVRAFHEGGIDGAEREQRVLRGMSGRVGGDGSPSDASWTERPPTNLQGCLTISHIAGPDARFDPRTHVERVEEWIASLVSRGVER